MSVRIAVLCATRRGIRFLERLIELAPGARFVVFTFPEEPLEPSFVEAIRRIAEGSDAEFHVARHVELPAVASAWEEAPDLLFAVNWRYRVPLAVYGRSKIGSFVFHDSLLPEYRGFSPTVWAMVNGKDHTGATLLVMAEEIDAGDIVEQERIPIGSRDTIAEVTERVTETYLRILERSLPAIRDGTFRRRAQDERRATYARRRLPEDNEIDWSAPTQRVHDLIRAVTAPYPGAYTTLRGATLRVWSAVPVTEARREVACRPGRVVEVRPGIGSVVIAGEGLMLLTSVQLEGDTVRCAADILDDPGLTLGDLR